MRRCSRPLAGSELRELWLRGRSTTLTPLACHVGSLLHSFLPFVGSAAASASTARLMLLRIATVCNAREIFSMVMESFVLFQVLCLWV